MVPFWEQVLANDPQLYGLGMFNQHYSTKAFTDDYYQVSTFEEVKIRMDDKDFIVYWYPELDKQSRLDTRDWYEKGYIRQDCVTVQDDSADIKAGKYASYMGVIKPGGEAEQATRTGGIEHVQIAVQTPFISNTASRATMTALSSTTKKPEAAIKMVEVMNSDAEVYNMLNFGIEGVNYNLVGGFVEEIPDSGYFYNTAWAIGNQFNAILKVGQQPGIWEETDKINRTATVSPISGFSFNPENVTSETAQIAAVIEEYRFIEYGDDFEAKFDEYQTKLVQAGIGRFCEEVQKQLDEWLVANGKK
jgi:putative aldouronate transport system substrate-binding protein